MFTVKALFFSRDTARVEELALALKIRWPDLKPLMVSKGKQGLQVIEQEEPDVVLMCENLPDMNLFAAISEVRRFSDVPIVVVTDLNDDMQGVKALDLGADDFITLQSNLMVVMVKVMALLRRVSMAHNQENNEPIRCGELLINPATFDVYLGSKALRLTLTEFRLLYLLARNRHITVSQDFIMSNLWSGEIDDGSKVKKYIQRLRRKLNDNAKEPRWIKTVHGMGYRLSPPVSEPELIGGFNAA